MSANISLINMMTSFAYILNSEYPSRPTWCILVVLNLVKSLRDVNKMSVCISLVVAGCWGVWFPGFTLYFWLLNVYITLSTFYNVILCLSSMIARGHYGVFATSHDVVFLFPLPPHCWCACRDALGTGVSAFMNFITGVLYPLSTAHRYLVFFLSLSYILSWYPSLSMFPHLFLSLLLMRLSNNDLYCSL